MKTKEGRKVRRKMVHIECRGCGKVIYNSDKTESGQCDKGPYVKYNCANCGKLVTVTKLKKKSN